MYMGEDYQPKIEPSDVQLVMMMVKDFLPTKYERLLCIVLRRYGYFTPAMLVCDERCEG